MSSETQQLVLQTADRLFQELAAAPAQEFSEGWARLEEAGFSGLLVPEEEGGFGGSFADAAAVLRLAGFHGQPAPLGETIIARFLLHGAGRHSGAGLLTLAPRCAGHIDAARFTGRLEAVPFGNEAETIVAALDGRLLALARRAASSVRPSLHCAGEPRATLVFEDAPVELAASKVELFALGAFARSCAMAGALDAALARSVEYANTRVQFAKPIAKFQAVQQSLAVFAEEAAAVNCAAQAAAQALDRGEARFEVACAKLRANMAAQIGVATAHQVHGAIGFTAEFGLHHLTGRLIAWSSEFGNLRYWAERAGALAAQWGAEGLWAEITRRGDEA